MKKNILLWTLLLLSLCQLNAQNVTEEYLTKNMVSGDLLEQFNNFTPDILIFNHTSGNRLILRGEKAAVNEARELLSFLDIEQKMVGVEFMVVEYFHGDDFDWSFDLTGGQFGNFSNGRITTGAQNGLQFIFNSISRLSPTFQMNLSALVSENKAKIVTNPHLTVQSGEQGKINISETINVFLTQTSQTGFITQELRKLDAGITLDITPIATHDSIVHLTMRGEISQFLSTSIDGDIRTDNKSIETKVDLKEGESLIIGGIISEQHNEIDAGFPILSKIPLIGLLFKRKRDFKQYVERVIYLTPRVYTANEISLAQERERYNDIRGVNPLEAEVMEQIETDPFFIRYKATNHSFHSNRKRRRNRRLQRKADRINRDK